MIGFVRNTLNALRCDVVMGDVVGDDLMQTTNPYYRTTYALVFKPGNGLDGIETLEDKRLKDKHIGIIAGTPPSNVLVQQGLMALARPYPLTADTRIEVPSQTMVNDIASGQIDAGVLWGPIAGYYAQHVTPHFVVVPLLKEPAQMDFRIAHGRAAQRSGVEAQAQSDHRRKPAGDRPDSATVRRAAAGRAGQTCNAMNAIVYRLTAVLCAALLLGAAGAANPPPEPSGYRMEDYRAPPPATLRGATVLSTEQAHALWEKHDAVFIDVLPQPPRPVGLPASTIWRPKPRQRHPGQCVAAGYRLRRAGTGHGRLFRTRSATGDRRQARSADRVLLSGKLLDVVECGETRAGARLFTRRLVPGRDRRLGRARPAAGRAHAGRAAAGGGMKRFHCRSCWIARASANSRCSILPGTSQA